MKKIWTEDFRRLLAVGAIAAAGAALVACDDGGGTTPEELNPDCDPLMEFHCSLPWPSNLYLEENATTETGVALRFGATTLPANAQQKHIDAAQFNTLDGYGPSSPILFHFANLDRSGWATENNMAPSVQANAQALLLRVNSDGTLTPIPYWVEEDLLNKDEANRIVFLRPAQILEEGTRYIVAFRNLKDKSGAAIARSAAFEALATGATAKRSDLAGRQARFDEIFGLLATHGVAKDDLTLAWDFVTASSSTLHGPMLSMRDTALAALEGEEDLLTITTIDAYQRDNPADPNYDTRIAFQFYGTFRAPNFMRPAPTGKDGTLLNLDANGVPQQDGWREEEVWIRIPWSAVGSDADPAGLIQYGHGLNGKGSQVRGGFNNRVAQEYNYIHFASDWTGMSEDDLPGIIGAVSDFSNFRWLSDRMHQGIIEFVVLARIMRDVFPTLDETVTNEVQVDSERMFYTGISQGGIYGATYVAVSPDINYGHLGVPGSNYSILLQRSVDFDSFNLLVKGTYKTSTNIAISLTAIQNLWDTSDPNSYYRHLSVDPFEGNDPKAVMLTPAKGDWQVSPLTTLIVANSGVGVSVMEGWGRDITHMGLTETPYTVDGENHVGSAIVLYDLGNPWPEPGNITHKDDLGDPHGTPRYFPEHQEQMIHFLEQNGEVIDVCNGNGCHFSRADSSCSDRETCWADD